MVILEKILNDLKAKLPFLNKGKREDEEFDEYEEDEDASQDDATDSTDLADLQSQIDEEDEEELEDEEEEEAPVSLVDKIKHKIKSFQKKSSPAGEEEGDEDEDEDQAAALKKKRSKIIQIVIGVAVVLFLLADFNEEGTTPESGPTDEFSDEIPDKTPPKTEPSTDTPAAETPVETAPTESPSVETPSVETPSVESPSVETPQVESPAIDTPSESEPDETAPVDTPSVTTEEPSGASEGETISFGDDQPDMEPTIPSETTDDASSIPLEFGEGDTVGEDIGMPGDENLTDQILQDLEKQSKARPALDPVKEYVAPPDYEYRGRGLVYNCVGKHWACVDGPSYKTCEDNASSVQYLKKKVECHPFNVYETTRGCESMQNRMVSSSAKTTFCNE